jgi:hypothetical protein
MAVEILPVKFVNLLFSSELIMSAFVSGRDKDRFSPL